MLISDANPALVESRIASPGLPFQIGPFTVSLQSLESSVASNVTKLYADFPLAEEHSFVDFRLQVNRPNLLRRIYRPQVNFFLDGEAPFKPLPAGEAYPFFEWGLNWCIALHAHHYLMLHAAVLEKNGHAIIMPAAPGSGKSTLCAALAFSGWRLLSDEFALISWDALSLTPLARPVSLKNESITLIKERFPHTEIGSFVENTSKGNVAHIKPPIDSVKKMHLKAIPRWLIFPRYQAGAATQLVPLSNSEAFMKAVENSFNYNQLGKQGFITARNLIENCRSFNFSYSNMEQALQTFNNLAAEC